MQIIALIVSPNLCRGSEGLLVGEITGPPIPGAHEKCWLRNTSILVRCTALHKNAAPSAASCPCVLLLLRLSTLRASLLAHEGCMPVGPVPSGTQRATFLAPKRAHVTDKGKLFGLLRGSNR